MQVFSFYFLHASTHSNRTIFTAPRLFVRIFATTKWNLVILNLVIISSSQNELFIEMFEVVVALRYLTKIKRFRIENRSTRSANSSWKPAWRIFKKLQSMNSCVLRSIVYLVDTVTWIYSFVLLQLLHWREYLAIKILSLTCKCFF